MPDYTYGPAAVLVETTGELAIGATGVLRPTEGGDPVPVYDLNGSPLASVLVGPKGAHQAFKAGISDGVLDFGSVQLPSLSLEAQRAAFDALELAQEAIEAAAAAEQSAVDAAATAVAVRIFTPGVRYVAASGSNSNDGRSPGTAFRQIQDAIAALPSGGKIVVLPSATDTYAPFDVGSTPDLVIEGWGGSGQDSQVGGGSVRIAVPSGGVGAKLAVGASGTVFQGATLRGLHFVGTTGALAGVQVGNTSNWLLEQVTVSDFLSVGSRGVYVSGNISAQYGTIRDLVAAECNIGLDVDEHNGLRVFGGFIENLPGGAVVPAGTIGVRTLPGADNLRVYGLVTQFLDVCYDLNSEASFVSGARCEAFNTGFIFRGDRGVLGEGAMFNNHIVGDGGRCVDIKAGATRTRIEPFHYAAVASNPVVDAGANTDRRDGLRVDRLLPPSFSATSGDNVFYMASNVGAVDSRGIRYCELQTGDTAIPASSTNYWTLTLKKRGSSSNDVQSITSQAGWPAYSRQPIDPAGAGGSDQTIVAGDRLYVEVTKTGSPPNLTASCLHMILVPR